MTYEDLSRRVARAVPRTRRLRRRFALCAAGLGASGLVACEDGPSQTFQPAPPGAATRVNDGTPRPVVDPSIGDYDASFPSHSRQEICSAAQKQQRWAAMLDAPIEPPRRYAGLDMAKNDLWEGLTIEDAEQINCQSTNMQPVDPGSGQSYWGDNQEVQFEYDLGTHIVNGMFLGLGYTGKMAFKGRACPPNTSAALAAKACPHANDAYEIHIGVPGILKNAAGSGWQTFLIHWDDQTQSDLDITELYDAAIATFSPETRQDANCNQSGACLVLSDDGSGNAIFGFRPLAVYFTSYAHTPQPVISTPYQLYNYFVKAEPYSNAPVVLKLDWDGPTAHTMLGPGLSPSVDCTLRLGQTFGDLVDHCVRVANDAKIDEQNYNKLVGGRTHDLEAFSFNVIGVNQNFARLSPDSFDGAGAPIFLKDTDVPDRADVAVDWTFDVRAQGAVQNDLGPGGDLDMHGTGLVFREYARLVQADLARYVGPAHTLGAPECLTADSSAAAPGCTGFEGLMIPGPAPAGTDPVVAKMYAGTSDPYVRSYLKPGDPRALFCNDPATQNDCNATVDGPGGPLWDASLVRVILVLGKGDLFKLPADVRDRRYFFRWYSIALIKYLKAVARHGTRATPEDVAAEPIDLESLFFDNNFQAAFDKAEYVDRSFMDAAHPIPVDFEYGSDTKVANQQYTNWFRRLTRPERAVYASLRTNPARPLGSENNVLLTNLFGSPVLQAMYSSWACALGTAEKSACSGEPAPLAEKNLNGDPLLSMYPGAWGTTVWARGQADPKRGEATIRIVEKYPDLQAAKVEVPQLANPYDRTSKATPIQVLVPWKPKLPGVGFTVPVSGSRDKAIVTAQLDFGGITSTYLVDYDDALDPDTGAPYVDAPTGAAAGAAGKPTGAIRILAIETQDFLGEVFLCRDPKTGDLLHARMYSSAGTILDWLSSHPGATDACDIVVRYSPYNNYPDYITSRANGVKLSISQGTGFGRVVDAMLYDTVVQTQ
jgi:hypothetical protein